MPCPLTFLCSRSRSALSSESPSDSADQSPLAPPRGPTLSTPVHPGTAVSLTQGTRSYAVVDSRGSEPTDLPSRKNPPKFDASELNAFASVSKDFLVGVRVPQSSESFQAFHRSCPGATSLYLEHKPDLLPLSDPSEDCVTTTLPNLDPPERRVVPWIRLPLPPQSWIRIPSLPQEECDSQQVYG